MDIQNGKSVNQLTFWLEEPLANHSQLPDSEKDSKIQEAGSCLNFLKSLEIENLDGLCGKMFPVFCHQTEEGILEPSSGRWGTWGMGSPIEFWTLNGSDSPKEESVCLLSDVLETGKIQQRYYLSPKACAGIIRRAEKRNKKLPEMLHQALLQVTIQAEVHNPAK